MSIAKGLGASALALALVACGGGGSSSPPATGGGGGTPAPSPSPSPAPITYTAFDDLTGDREFNTACANDGSFAGQQAAGITTFSDFFTFAFTEATETWRVAGPTLDDTFDSSFDPSNISSQQDGEFVVYRREFSLNGRDVAEFFAILTPQFQGGTAQYVRGGDAILFGVNNQQQAFYRCVFGVPTELDDELPTSSIVFNASLDANGNATVTNGADPAVQYNLDVSDLELTADPASGEIQVTLNVRGREITRDPNTGDVTVSDTETELGTFSGTTAITGDVQGFEGVLTDSNGLFVGEYSGWFFGPQGAEIGVALYGNQTRNDGSELRFGLSIAGPQG